MTTERIKRRIERLLDQLEEPQALRIGRRSRGCRGRWWPSIGRMPTPWRSWRWPATCADVVGHLTGRSLRPSSSTIPKTDRMYSSNEHFASRFLKASARNSSCPIVQTITDNIRLVSLFGFQIRNNPYASSERLKNRLMRLAHPVQLTGDNCLGYLGFESTTHTNLRYFSQHCSIVTGF